MDKVPLPTPKKPQLSFINFKFLGAFLALLVLLKINLSLLFPSHPTLASDLSLQNILNAVNEQRALRNLVTLNTNSKLSYAGQSKANDMQARHYFSHTDPDGKYIWDKIVAAGYTPYAQLGENLAIEFYDTESLIAAWMNSPTHRANILQEGFKDQGMGLAFGDSAVGQYHSAIANTFGALASAPQQKAPPPAPRAIVPPSPAPVPPVIPPAPPTPLPPPTPKEPLPLRGEPLAINNPPPNFSVPDQSRDNPTTSTSPTKAVVGTENQIESNTYKSNRYLILILGTALLLFLLHDLKQVAEQKFKQHFDKKTNNLLVLVIALIVIAYMYWI